MTHASGTWTGYYAYGPEYEELEGTRVLFTAQLIFTDDVFEGTCTESGPHAHREPSVIKGFTDEGMISFILKYPYFYGMDEQGANVYDTSLPHPDVHYSGTWNAETNVFEGQWEMVGGIAEDEVGKFEYFLTGTWEMKKEM